MTSESRCSFALDFEKRTSDFIFQVSETLNTITTLQCWISVWGGMATKSTHRRHFFVVRHHIVRTITQGSQPGSLDLLTPIPPVWKIEVAHQHWLANILAWFQTYMWCTGMKNRKILKNLLVTLCDRLIAKTCVWHGSEIQSPAVLGMTLLGTGAWSLLYKWFQMCRGAWAELQTAQ